MGFDLLGGAVANASDTTKLWYNRPGTTAASHALFLLPHAAHVAVAAWLFRGGDWSYCAAVSGYVPVAAAAVLAAPIRLKRPAAVGLALAGMGGWLYLLHPTPGLEWFVPALLLKLLLGHLIPATRPHAIEPGAVAHSDHS